LRQIKFACAVCATVALSKNRLRNQRNGFSGGADDFQLPQPIRKLRSRCAARAAVQHLPQAPGARRYNLFRVADRPQGHGSLK
jgi:hypothetical protein